MELPRKTIKRFALTMESKMQENSYKNGWTSMGLKELIFQLQGEAFELHKAIHRRTSTPDEIAREAADVANYAMMIATNAGAYRE